MKRKLVHLAILAAALTVAGVVRGQEPPVPPSPSGGQGMAAPPGAHYQAGPAYEGDAPVCEGCADYGSCDSCCGDGCGCNLCCAAPIDPYIYTRYDVMFLTRDMARSQDFTSLGVAGPIVLSTNDLHFQEEAVSRFLVGIPICDCGVIEASYFGLQDWEDTAAVTTPDLFNPELRSVYTDFGTNGFAGAFDPNVRESIDYESNLHNAELNYAGRCPCCCKCGREAWWLFGFRYTKVSEEFNYDTFAQDGSNQFETNTHITTDNDLIGFQLGLRASRRLGCKFRLEAEAKAGVFVNLVDEQTNLSLFDDSGNLQNSDQVDHERDDQIAMVTDAGVQLSYDVCCWLTLRAGYHVMYVDGLALAPENFDPNTLEDVLIGGIPPDHFNANGNILYRGATAGAEIRW